MTPPETPTGTPSRRGRTTILLLAAVAALGSLATQLLVPALPAIAHDLRTGIAETQLVVSVFLVGMGAGQLLSGPLTDRFGRRPVLLGGLAVYCIGSLGAALAPDLPLLLAARAMQALGASAGVVTARVLVGDLYPADEAAARQATLMAVVLISPALAPVIGGQLTEWVGWRAVFSLLAAAGLGGIALSATLLPLGSKAALTAATQPHQPTSLAVSYGQLLRNRNFVAATLAIAGGSAALYMFLGTAPFLLEHTHGLSPRATGQCLMIVALASIAGTFAVGRADRGGHALMIGTLFSFAGSAALLATSLAGLASIPVLLAPVLLLGFGAGMTGPSGIARVIRADPRMAGTAASLAGATQMLASALGASALGHFAPVDALRLACGLVVATAVAGTAATLAEKDRSRTIQGLAQAGDSDKEGGKFKGRIP